MTEAATDTQTATDTSAAAPTQGTTTDATSTATAQTAATTQTTVKTTEKTILDEGGTDAAPATTPGDWPEDWRERLADGDDKFLKELKRYTSPMTFAKGSKALKSKLSSGEFKRTLATDASAEEITEWRKENGIPEKPDGYDLALDKGVVVGEDEKPLINEFLNKMHSANAAPATVKAALNAYYDIVNKQAEDQHAKDGQIWTETEDALRAEWGNDFRRNQNLTTALLNEYFPEEGLSDLLVSARMADGTKIGAHPEIVRGLARLAREINPVTTLVPGGTATAASIDTELANLTKMMGDHKSAYWKGPEAAKNQARFLELTDGKQRIAQRR